MKFSKVVMFLLFILATTALKGQSKISYSLLFNQSGSLDPVNDICITRTNGGECLSMDLSYALNVTAALNYKLNDKVRLQTGLGFNQLTAKDINEDLDFDVFKANYLSVPIRAHWLISKGRLSPYLGGGLRADIRLNKEARPTVIGFRDNAAGFGVSAEFLLGLEYELSKTLSINVEPTYATGISNYDNSNRRFILILGPAIDLPLMAQSPQRMGLTVGLTFSLGRSTK